MGLSSRALSRALGGRRRPLGLEEVGLLGFSRACLNTSLFITWLYVSKGGQKPSIRFRGPRIGDRQRPSVCRVLGRSLLSRLLHWLGLCLRVWDSLGFLRFGVRGVWAEGLGPDGGLGFQCLRPSQQS